jgi:hypothetical protein
MAEGQETSDYPGSLDTWNTITDKEDLVEQSDINKIKAALLAIQTELGTDVAGTVVDLVTRLAVSLADSGAVAQGTSYPVSPTPVIGQPFYRTDTDQYAIYDGSSWDVIGPSGMTIKSVTSMSAVNNSGDITLEANKLYLVLFQYTQNTSTGDISIRFNSASGSVYDCSGEAHQMATTTPTNTLWGFNGTTKIYVGTTSGAAAGTAVSGKFYIDTTKKNTDSAFVYGDSISKGATYYEKNDYAGVFTTDTTITDFEFLCSSGTMTGSIYLYELVLST